jgi:SAM-dependent methyltransferase
VRLEWPAPNRNRDPILAVLREVLPRRGTVLEIASGTGQHAAYFSTALPGVTWQPTDADPAMLASIAEWAKDGGDVLPPVLLDVSSIEWPTADAIVCCNLVHISSWATTLALLDGAARTLPPGGPLFLYGPYKVGGTHVSESNRAFDEDLRRRNPEWGVRDLEAVIAAAAERGLVHDRTVEMPANNRSVVLRVESSS